MKNFYLEFNFLDNHRKREFVFEVWDVHVCVCVFSEIVLARGLSTHMLLFRVAKIPIFFHPTFHITHMFTNTCAHTSHINIPWSTCMCVHSVVSDSLWPCELQSTRLLCLWNSPGKNTGVDCHFLTSGEQTCIFCVSCQAGGFFLYQWATWEASLWSILIIKFLLVKNKNSFCRDKWD